jgi:flagella basal body P-ring formation protein FlgA
MKIALIAVSLVLFVLFAGSSFGQQTAVVEKRLTGLLNEAYGPRDMQVKLDGIPSLLKQNIKVRSVNVYTMPDVGGKGLAVVEFDGEDGKPRTSFLPFKVYEKKTLFYVIKSLPKGTPVSADDLGSKETYTSENGLIYPKDLQDIAGKVLKRDVAPGVILTTLMLDNPQVIHRGETVNLVVENKQLLVSTKGKAQEPGKVGEKIRVKNLTTDRELVGKVANDGTVLVEF